MLDGLGLGGTPDAPYHLTSERSARAALRGGLRGSSGGGDPVVRDARSLLDSARPEGYPPHLGSVFLWPSSKPHPGPREPIYVDPASYGGRCAAADLAVLERLIDSTDEWRRRELAERYWVGATVGTLAEADAAAGRYREAEILCEPPVPPSALSAPGLGR